MLEMVKTMSGHLNLDYSGKTTLFDLNKHPFKGEKLKHFVLSSLFTLKNVIAGLTRNLFCFSSNTGQTLVCPYVVTSWLAFSSWLTLKTVIAGLTRNLTLVFEIPHQVRNDQERFLKNLQNSLKTKKFP